jgi:hypothetical protein
LAPQPPKNRLALAQVFVRVLTVQTIEIQQERQNGEARQKEQGQESEESVGGHVVNLRQM